MSQPREARYPYRTIKFNRRVIASPIRSPLRPVEIHRSLAARIAARTGMVLRIAMWTGPKIPNFVCMAGSRLKRRCMGIDPGCRDQCGRLAPQRMQQLQSCKKFFPRSGEAPDRSLSNDYPAFVVRSLLEQYNVRLKQLIHIEKQCWGLK